MIKKVLTIAVLAGLTLSSCKKNESEKANLAEQTTETVTKPEAATVFGTYEGEIPCADCDGIAQKLTLNDDNSFVLESVYKGKGDGKPFTDKGTFTVENGIVQLSIKDAPSKYKIEDNYLEQLDIEGNKIESTLNYKLLKK